MIDLRRLQILTDDSPFDGVDCYTPATEFGGGNAIEVETGLFLYALVRRTAPRVVVQTGTHWGYSAAWIACALADNVEGFPEDLKQERRGHLWTVDVNAYEDRADRLLSRLGVRDYVTLLYGDSRGPDFTGEGAGMTSAVQMPELPGPIDFLYLDADHGDFSVKAEWRFLAPLLNREEAFVGFHDTRLDPREAKGIREILDERLYPLPEYQHIAHTGMRNMRGLDFFQLRREVLPPPPYPY